VIRSNISIVLSIGAAATMAPPANTVGPRLLTTTIVLPMVLAAAAAEPAAAVQGGKPSLHNQPAPEVYAIVEVAGKQMFVEPGKWYVCNRLQVSCTSHHLCISFQVVLSSCS